MSGERAFHPVAEPSRSDWAARITEAWRTGVESIIETGRRICAAKGALGLFEVPAAVLAKVTP